GFWGLVNPTLAYGRADQRLSRYPPPENHQMSMPIPTLNERFTAELAIAGARERTRREPEESARHTPTIGCETRGITRKVGGVDGTRTRGLRRDRPAF